MSLAQVNADRWKMEGPLAAGLQFNKELACVDEMNHETRRRLFTAEAHFA